MEDIHCKRFDIGQPIETVETEAQGRRWLFYWLVGADDAFCYMTDGSVYVEIINPHEWQTIYADALLIVGDPVGACDIACLRMQQIMKLRGDWKPKK
jgi:hypothetical protein